MIVPFKAEFLSTYFGIKQRERGLEYYRCKQVEKINKKNRSGFFATVKGTSLYTNEIELKGNTVHVSCDCPFFDENGNCKHVWASLLFAENEKIFSVDNSKRIWMQSVYYDDMDYEETVDGEWKRKSDDKKEISPKEDSKNVVFAKEFAKQLEKVKPFAPVPSWASAISDMTRTPYVNIVANRFTQGRIHYTILDNKGYSSQIAIEIGLSAKDAKGVWKKARAIAIKPEEFKFLDETDRHLLLQLFGSGSFTLYPYYYGSSYIRATTIATVPTDGIKDILPQLLATNRLYLQIYSKELCGPFVADSDPTEWELRATILPVKEQQPGYKLGVKFVKGNNTCVLSDVIYLSRGGIVLWKNMTASPLKDSGLLPLVTSIRLHGEPFVSSQDIPAFLDTFLNLADSPPLDMPIDLDPQKIMNNPRPFIRVHSPEGYENQNKVYADVCFDYDGEMIPAIPFQHRVYDSTKNIVLCRTIAVESGFLAQVVESGFLSNASNYGYGFTKVYPYFIQRKKMSSAISFLVKKNWTVEADGALFRPSATMSSSVTSSGTDWFDLELKCEFDGIKAGLPELLAALEKNESYVKLGDGSFGMLPEEWLRKIAPFTRMGKMENDLLRFKRSQALILDMLLAEQELPKIDDAFRKIRDELRTFSGINKAFAPPTFVGTLRRYQEEGLGWLYFLKKFGFGGCLADDMGLGKTIQVLALFAELYKNSMKKTKNKSKDTVIPLPSLIVAPRTLIFNWVTEAQKFVPKLKVLDFSHSERNEKTSDFSAYHIIMITYGTLRRDVENLMKVDFEYVVLDEAQSVKNSSTITAKAVRLLRANYRLALSGTPVENHLGELWSIFEFLNPGMLGSARSFVSTEKSLTSTDEATIGRMRTALRPFILRRTKSQVATDLPEKQEETIYCEMETAQRKLYNELKNHYRASLLGTIKDQGMAKTKILILEALLRLRQAACHPGLIDKKRIGEKSAKLEALFAQLDEIIGEGHKAIIFSQFTSLLAIVKMHLDKSKINYEYLDGQTQNRQERVLHFQSDPLCPLFLISLKAGGVGLNLTAAEYVFLLDPWWNPAVEAQAIDRAHRIGQTKPVFAYRLICKDTVEEKILEMQKSKRQLAESIISADSSILRTLKEDDLMMLLS